MRILKSFLISLIFLPLFAHAIPTNTARVPFSTNFTNLKDSPLFVSYSFDPVRYIIRCTSDYQKVWIDEISYRGFKNKSALPAILFNDPYIAKKHAKELGEYYFWVNPAGYLVFSTPVNVPTTISCSVVAKDQN